MRLASVARRAFSTRLAETYALGRVGRSCATKLAETYVGASRLALWSVLANPQSGVPRPQNRLSSVRDLKFGKDRRQVVGDRLR